MSYCTEKGFTLFEVLVYMAVALLLFSLLFSSFFSVTDAFMASEKMVDMLYEKLFESYV